MMVLSITKKPMIGAMVIAGIKERTSERANRANPRITSVSDEAQQEQACVEAVKAGDVNAFRYLVEAHQTRVYNLALRMLGNEQEAQDATQDAFVQAYTRLASYRSEWRFKTWIMAITSNLCIDRLRRRRIEPLAFSDHTEDPDAEFISYEPQPDVVTAAHERRDIVRAMLRYLSVEDRSMVVMFYWGDMSYEEIAQATNSTVNAVKSRLFRARRALAQLPQAASLASAGVEMMP